MDPLVGDKECSFLEVVNVLRESKSFDIILTKLFEIARNLYVPDDQVRGIKVGMNTQLISYHEAIWEILVGWRAKKSDQAKLGVLAAVLRNCDVGDAADNLEKHFKVKRTRTATYSSPPEGMANFLKSEQKVLVISSMDKHVTAMKLMDTDMSIHMHDLNDFAVRLTTGESQEVYSVSCNYEYGLSELLELTRSQIQCRAIVITDEELDQVQKTCSTLKHVMVTKDSLQWSHLSTPRRLIVPGNSIKLSGKIMKFRDVAKIANVWGDLDQAMAEQILVDLIYDKHPNLIENTIPNQVSYYVSRRIRSRTLLDMEEIFKKANLNDVFVFTGIARHELSKYAAHQPTDGSSSQLRKERTTVRFMLLDMISDFDHLMKKVKGPLHWVEYKEGKFYWVRSAGTMDVIQKAIDYKSEQEEYSEAKFLEDLLMEHCDHPVLISDTPGMGKSQLLANFSRKIEDNGRVVLFGVMSKIVALVKEKMAKRVAMKKALIDIVSGLGGGRTCLAREYLIHALESGRHEVHLMLDGFDEVRADDLELAEEMLQTMRANSMARLWITTRPHFLEGLENILQVLGYRLLPFDYDDQRECLVKYWKQEESCLLSRLREYADMCLGKLHDSMRSRDHDIAGVPLQCTLIGELYEMEARNYAKPGNLTMDMLTPSIRIGSVADLFHRLLERKLDKYFERYASNNFGRDELKLAHMFLSIQLLFPEWENELKEFLQAGLKVQLKDILNVGLLEMMSNEGIPNFIHRTVAEFFVALCAIHLMDNKEGVRNEALEIAHKFVTSVLASEKHKTILLHRVNYHTEEMYTFSFKHHVVVYFLDNLLQISNTQLNLDLSVDPRHLAHSCIHGNFANIFKSLWHTGVLCNDPNTKHRECDKDLVFASVRFSDVELIQMVCEMFEKSRGTRVRDIAVNDADFHGGSQFNDEESTITILDVAVANREYSVVDHLITCQGFLEFIKTHNERIRNLVHSCVAHTQYHQMALLRDKVEALRLLCSLNKRFVDHLDGISPLFCPRIHETLMGELISLGTIMIDLNKSDQPTLLHVAVDNLDPDEYHKVIKQIPPTYLTEMLEIRDRITRTPLHKIIWKFDPDAQTLQLFQEHGADFNAVLRSGYSVITLAIIRERSMTTIEQLISHGADWQVANPNGLSILHIALTSSNFPAFQYFALKLTRDRFLREKLQRAGGWADLGDLSLMKLKIDPNAKDSKTYTLLHTVVQFCIHKYGQLDIIKLLISSGVNINATTREGHTPFDLALKISDHRLRSNIALLLHSHGAVSSQQHAYIYLKTIIKQMTAEEIYFNELVDKILESWPNTIKELDDELNTLLHHAILKRSFHWLEYFLEKRVDVNARNKRGETPLHLAIATSFIDMTEVILLLEEHGADLAAFDNENRTPLHLAVEKGHSRIAEYLLSTTAYRVFKCAEEEGLDTFQEHLRQHNIENVHMGYNGALLHFAARNSGHSIFEFLIERLNPDMSNILSLPNMSDIVRVIVRDTVIMEQVEGKVKMLQLVQRKGYALLNSADKEGTTPVLCRGVHVDLLIWLLDNGVDPMVVDNCKRNLLYIAAESLKPNAFTNLVEHLVRLGHGILVTGKSRENSTTVIHQAAKFQKSMSRNTLEHFKNNGADFYAVDERGENVLFHAVRGYCDLNFLTDLLELSIDCTIINNKKQSLLHVGCLEDHVEAVRLFCGLCDVNNPEEDLNTPLHSTLKSGRFSKEKLEIAKMLVSAGADVAAMDKRNRTPVDYGLLRLAALFGDTNAIQVFLDKGCDVYSKDKNGHNLIHFSAQSGNPKVFHDLLQWILDNLLEGLLEEKDYNLKSTLHLAATFLELDAPTLDILLMYNNIHDIDNNGNNVLFNAILGNRSLQIINLLISHGADWQCTNNDQNTVLHMAARWGSVDVLRHFIEKGCDVNCRNKEAETPLHFVFNGVRYYSILRNSAYEIISLLVEHAADVKAEDLKGRTPLDVAEKILEHSHVKGFVGSSRTLDILELLLTQKS